MGAYSTGMFRYLVEREDYSPITPNDGDSANGYPQEWEGEATSEPPDPLAEVRRTNSHSGFSLRYFPHASKSDLPRRYPTYHTLSTLLQLLPSTLGLSSTRRQLLLHDTLSSPLVKSPAKPRLDRLCTRDQQAVQFAPLLDLRM